jgi:hypothetical protein
MLIPSQSTRTELKMKVELELSRDLKGYSTAGIIDYLNFYRSGWSEMKSAHICKIFTFEQIFI